jgi:HK97 family phage major capsid protein/HK97 family phage prohead protease
MQYAHAPLTIKALEPTARRLTGIASTRNPDRQADIFEPSGATFTNPLPLLLQHDRTRPVGQAILTATADAILFEASLPAVETPGPLRDRITEAWDSIQAGLIRGVSIGYRPLKDGVEHLKSGGLRFLKTEICELSLVTIPANIDATILTVKRFDEPPPTAAIGLTLPGAAGRSHRGAAMTTAEQITELEGRRATIVGQMTALLEDDRMDEAKQKEYDSLEAECQTLDAKLPRLKTFEKTLLASANPLDAPLQPPRAPGLIRARARSVEPGTAFVRYCKALAASRGDTMAAIGYAKEWRDSTPEVELILKAATGPASTVSTAWAGALVPSLQHLGSEFMELLRPATVIGRIPGLRRVPFNVSVPKQTGGGTYRWVGEGSPKPVTQLVFATVTLAQYKIAGILTFTYELARSSEPSAEQTFRDEMVAGIAQFMDAQFLDPAVALVAGINPASITNGVAGIVATADPLADITNLLNTFVAANIPISGVVLIMSESNAFILGSRRTSLGEPVFPGVSVTGGSINGVPIIVSSATGTNIIAVVPRYVLYADDGGVSIDVSREASLQMVDTPGVPDATTVFRSLWQDNLVGLRAERFCAWIKAHASAVNMITGTAYTPSYVEPPALPLSARSATKQA